MGKKIGIDKIDRTAKELKGLEDRGQVDFDCIECNTPLLVVQQASIKGAPKNEVLTRIVVKCGFCNIGYSFVKQITGIFYTGSPNDGTIIEPIDNDENAPEADVLFMAQSK